MKPIPSSVSLSLVLAVCMTAIFLVLRVSLHGLDQFGGGELIIFYIASFFLSLAALEVLLYRRLKSQDTSNKEEIQKLKVLETYRREFLGEVSHELKTPIFAVQGFIHTLIDGAMDDKKVRMRFLKKAQKNADRLSNLVNDLLIVTQLESGEVHMNMHPFDVNEMIDDVMDSLEYKFTRKGRNVSWRVETEETEQVRVMADRERILQVLSNLVDNAIKYGDSEGAVVIRTLVLNDKVEIQVIDDGPGIDPEHLNKVFRRFYRIDKSRSRDTGGTGLGLAICKHLIEAHNERIWVNSEVGKGTVFHFSLPVVSYPDAEEPAA